MPPEGGILFKGTKGKIMAGVYSQRPMLLPAALDKDYKRPAKTIPRVEGEAHELNWVRAAKAGKPAVSNFEYAAHLTEICLLGNLAKRMDCPPRLGRAEHEGDQLPRGEPIRADRVSPGLEPLAGIGDALLEPCWSFSGALGSHC